MTNLTSAGQLAGVEIVATATVTTFLSALFQIILTQLVINARYFLMSLTLSQKLDDKISIGQRFLFSAFITDEIFAVSSSKISPINKKYFLGLVILPYVGWSLGTLLGAVAGDALPVQITNALGIALYAMFIAIIIPPAISVKGVLPAVLIASGLSIATYYIPIFSSVNAGFKYIFCALISAFITAYFFPIKQQEEQENSYKEVA